MSNKDISVDSAKWDLSVLYSGVDDPRINSDVAEFEKAAKEFHVVYRGHLAEKLGAAIADYSRIKMLEDKLEYYLFLQQSLNVSDAAVKAKIAEVGQAVSRACGEYLEFFHIEITEMDGQALARLYEEDTVVAWHKPWLEHLRVFKPHLLSEPVESALTKRSPFGPDTWGEFYDELGADLRFSFHGEEKTLEEMLDVITESRDADERAEAMKIVNDGLSGTFSKYSAQTLYMVYGSSALERIERGYKHPMDAMNKSSRVPDEAVDALHAAVMDVAAPLARRYYRLKAAHLGLKTLRWSDRNAPMPFADKTTVSFNEAMDTVLAAYGSFSPTLAKLVQRFVAEKRIDAPATKGKRTGAFNCSFVLPGNSPISFILLNYLGSNRDVMTIAHECGHGVHGILAGEKQGTLMYHAPIAYCETASVFGEMTTFNFLKDRALKSGDAKSLVALTMSKIDSIINTVVRQISFSNFERRAHGMDSSYKKWGEPKKLSAEELDGIWLETTKEIYGRDGEVFTYENAEHLWSYVPHFHRPFYVYGYAFGELLTHSLYAQKSRLGDRFEPLYLDLLRSGSTKDVVELLQPFGLDPTDKNFWIDGIRVGLGAMIEEAEKLSEEMGIAVS